MSKIVLVETVQTFRHLYALELNDTDPNEYALDSVTHYNTGGESKLEEFAQQHISEDIFSHRVISEDEYVEMFDQMNDYLKQWPVEQKKRFIYKEEQ